MQRLMEHKRSYPPFWRSQGISHSKGSLWAESWENYMNFQWFIILEIQDTDPNLSLVSSVQSLSHVQLFATSWNAARQASLSITNSQSLLKLMSIESVMPSNHLILCRPLLLLPSIFPSIRFSYGVSSSHQVAKVLEFQLQHVLPMNIQDWFLLG